MVSSSDENVFQTKEGDCVSTGWQATGRGMSVVKFSSGEEGFGETGLEGLYGLISNSKRITTSLEAISHESKHISKS